MNGVEKYIFEKYQSMIETLGYSFYYVEFQKKHKDVYLRLYIEPLDDTQIMDIDACEKVSRAFGDAFDQDSGFPISDAYILEVSSPGIERTLHVPEHFKRYVGEKIRLGLYKSINKKKEFVSILKSANDSGIVIDDDGVMIELDYKDISRAQLYCDF